MARRHNAWHTRHPGGHSRINCRRWVMKMDDVRTRLFEKPVEIPRGVRQVPAHVRLHGEAFPSHLFAERTQCRDRADARIVPLIPLQTAHLRHEHLSPANLHGVYNVSNPHTGCLNLRKHGAGLSPASSIDPASCSAAQINALDW